MQLTPLAASSELSKVTAAKRRNYLQAQFDLLRSRRSRKDSIWALVFLLPQLVGLLLFCLYPVFDAFRISLTDWTGFGAYNYVGLENYRDQLNDPVFITSLKNTAIFTLIGVPGTVIGAFLLAVAVNNIKGRMIYRVIFFLPTVTSSVAISMIWMLMLNGQFGLVNSWINRTFGVVAPNWFVDKNWVIPTIAIIAIWQSIGYNMIIFLAGLQGIPRTYYEAASLDGAGRWRVFRDITIPLVSPTTFLVTVLSIIGSFQVFDFIYVATGGGPGYASRTMVYHIYDLAFVDFQFGLSSASAIILFGIILVFTAFQFWGQRKWVNYDM